MDASRIGKYYILTFFVNSSYLDDMKNIENNVIAALSESHVTKITGLSKGQLRAWDKRGFFVPQHAFDDRSAVHSRIYSFKDAVGLRTLARVRAEHKVSIKRLEKLAFEMEKDGIDHWADAKVWMVNGELSYLRPGDTDEVKGAETGQLAMLPIIDVIKEVAEKVEDLKRRQTDTLGNVNRDRYVARNSWVVSGTRIPTATILRYSKAGYSVQDIINDYPSLTVEDIEAAIEHEKSLLQSA